MTNAASLLRPTVAMAQALLLETKVSGVNCIHCKRKGTQHPMEDENHA